jgi:hypothetical protein
MTRPDALQAAEQRYRQALADYTSLLVELGRDKEAADINARPLPAGAMRTSAESGESTGKTDQV